MPVPWAFCWHKNEISMKRIPNILQVQTLRNSIDLSEVRSYIYIVKFAQRHCGAGRGLGVCLPTLISL